ncbi:phosphate propanoyltransferase [Patescibacteria group bacterium]|nr:phosphate propanoyltransferase [Patescibacteria group bacterium]
MSNNKCQMKVPIEVSARHVHISREDLDILFGKGYKLTSIKDLSQKGQFAAKEKVDIKTAQGELKELRILGPEREQTQVEITKTESHELKIDPPVAECTSCVGEGGAEVIIIGPKGEVKKHCAIIAHRHIHCSPDEAEKNNLKEGQLLSVKTNGSRPITFHQVLVRIDPTFVFRMHLDTDEANAAGIEGSEYGEIGKEEIGNWLGNWKSEKS